LESAYEAALAFELNTTGLKFDTQVALPMIYETLRLEIGYRLDILVEDTVIIEIKSVETLLNIHHKQVIT
jgi:GxxExxY protein